MARLNVWQPFGDVMAMNMAMDRMARHNQRMRGRQLNGNYSIACDLTENQDGYMIQAALPGVTSENLTIDFADDVLTIKAENPAAETIEGVRYHLRELAFGTYERSFRFPLPINADAIEARLEQGFLTLYLPKAESVKPRRIDVQVSV